MHPVVFLDALDCDDEMEPKWLIDPKGQLTFDSEGDDLDTSIYFSRQPHVPNNNGVVIGLSGVTFGRGLDIGQQSESIVRGFLTEMEINARPLFPKMTECLIGAVGVIRGAALTYCNNIDQHVPKNEQRLTRKQQHFHLLAVYNHQYTIPHRF